MNINCVVIDANQQSVCVLLEAIKQFKQVNVVATFDNPVQAFDCIAGQKIDFVFLAPEFKNEFEYQTISKLENKPLLVITDTEGATDNLFSVNASYILNPHNYFGFFQSICSLRS